MDSSFVTLNELLADFEDIYALVAARQPHRCGRTPMRTLYLTLEPDETLDFTEDMAPENPPFPGRAHRDDARAFYDDFRRTFTLE